MILRNAQKTQRCLIVVTSVWSGCFNLRVTQIVNCSSNSIIYQLSSLLTQCLLSSATASPSTQLINKALQFSVHYPSSIIDNFSQASTGTLRAKHLLESSSFTASSPPLPCTGTQNHQCLSNTTPDITSLHFCTFKSLRHLMVNLLITHDRHDNQLLNNTT